MILIVENFDWRIDNYERLYRRMFAFAWVVLAVYGVGGVIGWLDAYSPSVLIIVLVLEVAIVGFQQFYHGQGVALRGLRDELLRKGLYGS